MRAERMRHEAIWARLDRIEARQEEILTLLRGKITFELEVICQAVGGQHVDVTTNGEVDGRRLADDG